MAKVFLSYAREDADAAKQLAEGIGGAGHEVWWDRHIQGGSRFSSEIDRELKSAEAVVVLWSAASVESAWVQDEAAEGRDSGRLVPVSLNGSRPPLGFRQFHTVELADDLADLLEAISKTAGNKASASVSSHTDAKKPQGVSICVLPFVNMSGDPEQEYFSDGITEDIITDLSKVSALFVVARNTAFTFKGKVMDVKEVAQRARRHPRPRRQRAQGRRPGADHRPADRRQDRRSRLGRPLRPRPYRHLRDPGRDFQGDRRRLAGEAPARRKKGDRDPRHGQRRGL